MVLLAVLPPLGLIVYTAAEWRRHEISEAEARAIMERTRAKYLPGTSGPGDP